VPQSYPDLRPLYDAARSYLEIPQRINLLNTRVEVLQDMLQLLKESVSSRHEERLEQIVIVLIAIEISMFFFSNLLVIANPAHAPIFKSLGSLLSLSTSMHKLSHRAVGPSRIVTYISHFLLFIVHTFIWCFNINVRDGGYSKYIDSVPSAGALLTRIAVRPGTTCSLFLLLNRIA
jgi:hypothetical protein